MARLKVACLISGRGSNMAAILEAARDPAYPAEVVLVLANRPDAGGLATAAAAGVATAVVDHRAHKGDREGFEREMQAAITASGAEFVCLAGFMRLLTPWFVELWRDRMLNIHPALLPSYKGLHTHERALADGVKIHGCTVHFVRAEMDVGPIVAQGAVPVLSDDTPATLAARVLAVENRLYPRALAMVASGRARVEGERVTVTGDRDGASLVAPA